MKFPRTCLCSESNSNSYFYIEKWTFKVMCEVIFERNEIRKKQHDFKCVHFECRMVLFYMICEKSRLFSHRVKKKYILGGSFSSSLSTVVETSQISPESWVDGDVLSCKISPIFATGRNAEKCANEFLLAKSESNLKLMNITFIIFCIIEFDF